MQDIEKQRAEYVTKLELLVQNLQKQLNELQAEDRWIPKFGASLEGPREEARLTLSFGGKNQTAVFSFDFLAGQSVTDATTNIIEAGFKDMIYDRFREVVAPEVERLKKSVDSIASAGKWA
jgi:hypothetical protein